MCSYDFSVEKKARMFGNLDIMNVTIVIPETTETAMEVINFQTERCAITCVGYNIYDGVPPPAVDEARGDFSVAVILFCITAVRVVFLLIETFALGKICAFFERRQSGMSVAPSLAETATPNTEEGGNERERKRDAAIRHVSEVGNDAARVFENVTPIFLCASFMLAMNACWYGLHTMAMVSVEEGIEVVLVE